MRAVLGLECGLHLPTVTTGRKQSGTGTATQAERYESLLKNIADKVGSIAGDIQHTLGVRYYP